VADPRGRRRPPPSRGGPPARQTRRGSRQASLGLSASGVVQARLRAARGARGRVRQGASAAATALFDFPRPRAGRCSVGSLWGSMQGVCRVPPPTSPTAPGSARRRAVAGRAAPNSWCKICNWSYERMEGDWCRGWGTPDQPTDYLAHGGLQRELWVGRRVGTHLWREGVLGACEGQLIMLPPRPRPTHQCVGGGPDHGRDGGHGLGRPST